MKRPGLTEAMRRALSNLDDVSESRVLKLCEQGFAERRDNPWIGYFYLLTPRGQAALAAPRVTAAELASLEAVERSGIRQGLSDKRLDREGWIARDYVGAPWKLTPAGTTALNNVRAASGSEEWREVP